MNHPSPSYQGHFLKSLGENLPISAECNINLAREEGEGDGFGKTIINYE
jgi:hypothetical protein